MEQNTNKTKCINTKIQTRQNTKGQNTIMTKCKNTIIQTRQNAKEQSKNF